MNRMDEHRCNKARRNAVRTVKPGKVLRLSFPLLAALAAAGPLQAQNTGASRLLRAFAGSSAGWFEGYASANNANTFAYQSLQADCREAMITRADEGSMPIDWNTAVVPKGYDIRKGATFLFLVDKDLGQTEVFDLFVDGKKRFSFGSRDELDWSLRSQDGGELSYATFVRDQYGDSRGYMTLHAPAAWLHPGKPLRLKISAVPVASQAWFMVFRAPDAAAFLRKRMAYEGFFRVQCERKAGETDIQVEAFGSGDAAPLRFRWGGESHIVKGLPADSMTVYHCAFPSSADGRLKVFRGTTMLFSTDTLFAPRSSNTVTSGGIISRRTGKPGDGSWQQEITLRYRPRLAANLEALSRESTAGERCLLMNSSHQDIAWMDSPEKCILMRDTMVITPMLKRMEEDPAYHFDIEDVLMIREYVKRHPDSRERIRHFLDNGQLNVGGSFNMPYEDMYGAESLVREFYQGALWMQKAFGYKPVSYWNVDVPGRTLQMPQILSRAGIRIMILSRMGQGLFRWKAPDGSSVLTYSPGHYDDLYAAFQNPDPYAGLSTVAAMSMALSLHHGHGSGDAGGHVIPLLWDSDMLPPGNDRNFPAEWNSLATLTDSSGVSIPLRLPPVQPSTSAGLYRALDSGSALPTIEGERPDVWVYIHGPSHERALHASRDADILLPAAEKFLTVASLLEGNFDHYPSARLARAWEAKIYPDHGWGGNHGDITDNLFLQKFLFAREEGKDMLEEALKGIAGRIKFREGRGRPVVVFNALSWKRSGPAAATLHFREGKGDTIRMLDDSGRVVPVQLKAERRYPDHSLEFATVCFIAWNVPSIGYRTYYAQAVNGSSAEANTGGIPLDSVLVSDHYRIRLGRGGLASVFDRDLHAELLRTDKFLGGEVFTMRSVGNGAGEFADIQQPDMQGFDETGMHPCQWQIISNGPVYTAIRYTCRLRYATVQQTVLLYRHLKRIDFRTDLLNWEGVLYREFRMAFPLKMQGGTVAYSVPFGVLHVGRNELPGPAGERYKTDCRLVHPRGIDAWIGAADASHTVTLSSDVAVADYLDPTAHPVSYPVLQPVLLASRKSCNSNGNEYLQTGGHHFTFSLMSGDGDSLARDRSGVAAHVPFYTVTDPPRYSSASLPEAKSFARVSGSVRITAIKKAENGDKVCFRLYNTSGVPVYAALRFFLPFTQTMETDLIENALHPLKSQNPLLLTLAPHAIITLVTGASR